MSEKKIKKPKCMKFNEKEDYINIVVSNKLNFFKLIGLKMIKNKRSSREQAGKMNKCFQKSSQYYGIGFG